MLYYSSIHCRLPAGVEYIQEFYLIMEITLFQYTLELGDKSETGKLKLADITSVIGFRFRVKILDKLICYSICHFDIIVFSYSERPCRGLKFS